MTIATWIQAQTTADGLVLLDLNRGEVLASNSAGAFIWRAIEQQLDAPAIASSVAERYGIPAEQAAKDVDDFIAGLRKHGIVTV